jgi:hypothetical protein
VKSRLAAQVKSSCESSSESGVGQFEELKLLVKESNAMKEILTSIFGSPQLLLWRKFFSKSEYYNYEQCHQHEPTQKETLL